MLWSVTLKQTSYIQKDVLKSFDVVTTSNDRAQDF